MNVETRANWRPLKALLGGLVDVPERLEVSDITHDSRSVTPGAAFLACQGRTHHGLEFAHSAVAAGARAILWEPAPGVTPPPLDAAVVVCAVPNLSAQLGFIADRFFDAPSATLTVAGITGTNGKTTCAWLLAQALEFCGRRSAYIGTLGAGIAGALKPLAYTTPDALSLHRLLAKLRSSGFDSVAMEVSSHALEQNRCAGVRFHTAVFTNLTRDHLDYHQTMEKYYAAKRLLFDGTVYPAPRVAVINAHDERAAQLAAAARRAGAEVHTYGTDKGDWRAANFVLTASGAILDLETPAGAARVETKLAGEVNILNLLASLTAAHARGVPFADLVASVPSLNSVPGRFQSVDAGQPFTVIVDYAHTDDALRNLTTLARQMTKQSGRRVITLFGCGGDRDRTKRARMGLAAGEGSDFVVATSDNPRSEDPLAILAEVEPGLKASGVKYSIEPERTAAIRLALEAATAGDVVLIAGKGHEKQQILNGRTIPFDDTEVALATLGELGGKMGYGKGQ